MLSKSISSPKKQSDELIVKDDFFDLKKDMNRLIFPENSNEYSFNLNDLNFLNDIYLGQMNTVKRYLHKPSRHILVAKITRLPTKDYKDEFKLRQFSREIQALRSVSDCPSIVKFYGLCIVDNNAYIFMEFMDLSLKDVYLLVHHNNKFPENILGYIAVAIVDALKFCSKKDIIHRDLKPGNVLLNKSGEIKLCDFGVSNISEESCSSTYVGTVAYWPPERFEMNKMKYDSRSDIWSLGIMLAEVALGKHPFICFNENALSSLATIQEYIARMKKSGIFNFLQDYSKDFIEFLGSCFKKYEKRPKCQKLMEMNFYTDNQPVQKEEVVKLLEDISPNNINLTFYDSLLCNPLINCIKFTDINRTYKFIISDFEEKNQISKRIWKYVHSPSGKEIAVKIVSLPQNENAMDEINKQIITSLVKEIQNLYDLQNEANVVKFYGLGIYQEQALICMEYMDMSLKELCNIIHESQLTFPEQLLGCLVVAVINALISCKVCDVINHAIKPANIFISNKRQIKLSCFDRSRFTEALFESVSTKESVEYMYYWPPEKFQSGIEQNDYKADIWALGLTLCELVFGVIPFLYENNYPCIKDISDLNYKLKTLDVDKLIMEIFSVNYFSENLREFVRLCLLPVDKRPRYNLLIKTAFYRQYESFGDEDKVSTCLHDIELKIGRSL